MKFRVASYNIRKAVGLDYRRDPARILRVIAALGADIVFLQEADKRLGERERVISDEEVLARTGLVPARTKVNDVSMGWHGNAILLRPDLDIRDVKLLNIPQFEPRGAVGLDLKLGEIEIYVFGVHLSLLRIYRQKQLEAIATSLSEEKRRYSIISGDYNEWSLEKGTEPLLRHYRVLSPGASFHASRPFLPLDRISVGDAFEIHGNGVWREGEALRASDHLPIYADLELSG